FHGDFAQRIVGARKAGLIHVRRPDEGSVQPVRPAVIRAQNPSVEVTLRVRTHARAAMAADVKECPDLAGLVACDNDALAAYVAEEVVAGAGDLLGAAPTDPAVEVELLHLAGEQRG